MGVYDHILVPLEGGETDAVVLEHVGRLAEACGADVTLLRVAHYHTRDQRACELEDAEGDLARAAEQLRSRGITVRTEIASGEPQRRDRAAGRQAAPGPDRHGHARARLGQADGAGQRGRPRAAQHRRAAPPAPGRRLSGSRPAAVPAILAGACPTASSSSTSTARSSTPTAPAGARSCAPSRTCTAWRASSATTRSTGARTRASSATSRRCGARASRTRPPARSPARRSPRSCATWPSVSALPPAPSTGSSTPASPATWSCCATRSTAARSRRCRASASWSTALAADRRALVGLLTGNVEEGARLKLEPTGLLSALQGRRLRLRLGAARRPAGRRRGPRRGAHGRRYAGKDVVVIGDTPADVECGASLGVTAVAVATGRHSVDELAAHAPDHVFADFSDWRAAYAAIMGDGRLSPAWSAPRALRESLRRSRGLAPARRRERREVDRRRHCRRPAPRPDAPSPGPATSPSMQCPVARITRSRPGTRPITGRPSGVTGRGPRQI